MAVVSSTTSFSENVVMAKISYQMLGILSFSDRERASPPSTEISVLTLVVKKYKEAFRGIHFKEQARKLKIKCRPRGRPGLVLKTKTRKTWVQANKM